MKLRAIRPSQFGLLLAIALVYVAAWFGYYSELPAGQYLGEAAEVNVAAARGIAGDEAANQSSASGFSLYTFTLSLGARIFETDEGLVAFARSLNAVAMLWVTVACAAVAAGYWRSNRAVWIAGLLAALNPVLVFWSGEISPALFAAASMSAGIAYWMRWFKSTRTWDSLLIALFLTLASAWRTALLPFALAWPIIAFFYPIDHKIKHLGLSLLPLILLIGTLVLTGLSLQTPWQWGFASINDAAGAAYAALANPEIDQGKSYTLHQELHWLLFLNPIHWGALFILAGAGLYVRFAEHRWSPTVLGAVFTLLLFAVSFALNGGGSQLRVSMIPLVTIFAAGAYRIPSLWKRSEALGRLAVIGTGLFLAIFSYAGNLTTDRSGSWATDYAYLAHANLAHGQSARATTWAEKALKLDPGRLDMQEVRVLAQFNEWALASQPRTLPIEAIRDYLATAETVQHESTLRSIRGIYLYKLNDRETAFNLWRTEKETTALARLCLYWTGQSSRSELGDLERYADSRYFRLLKEAVQVDRNALKYTDFEKQIDNMLAPAY